MKKMCGWCLMSRHDKCGQPLVFDGKVEEHPCNCAKCKEGS